MNQSPSAPATSRGSSPKLVKNETVIDAVERLAGVFRELKAHLHRIQSARIRRTMARAHARAGGGEERWGVGRTFR